MGGGYVDHCAPTALVLGCVRSLYGDCEWPAQLLVNQNKCTNRSNGSTLREFLDENRVSKNMRQSRGQLDPLEK